MSDRSALVLGHRRLSNRSLTIMCILTDIPSLSVVTLSNDIYRPVAANTALNAEWEKDWKESTFEADLAKVQKEAEERLEEKVAELASNIENTGK
jgi:hypothetical protein